MATASPAPCLEGATELSTLSADRAVYSKSNPVPVALRDPATDKGHYTAIFLAKPAPNGGLAADAFPPGDGYGLLSVSRTGVVKMVGALADGSHYSYANTLSATNRWPFYVALYKKTGSCTGEAVFRDVAGQSDLDGLDFQWFCPDRSSAGTPPERYPQAGLRASAPICSVRASSLLRKGRASCPGSARLTSMATHFSSATGVT
jgi:hypothetical protein